MDYDPIKDRLGAAFTRSPLLHRAFFRALDAVFLRAWYVHREARRVVEALPPSRSVHVLDAGTGFGQYAYFLLREYPHVEVTAVDVKADYLATARHFFDQTPFGGRITFREHDLTEPLPETDHFDLALSVDVMEHIEDDRAVFRAFRSALRAGGTVVVNTPSDRGGSGITEAGGEGFIGEHVRDGYAPAELRAKLEESGLEVERWAYTYGRYGSAAWRLLVQGPILALSRSMALGALLPLYYAGALPVGLALNALDVRAENAEGTGLLMTARKPLAL